LRKAGIPFLDERGRRMDYHALRTTFITRLSTMKVHPRLAMELARHSDMRLTMKTYTDVGQLTIASQPRTSEVATMHRTIRVRRIWFRLQWRE
jgi:hypothetical protein